MKIRSKSTNKNYLILSAIFTLSIATVFGVGIYTANTTNALSYSTSEDVSFTFKPTLSIGLSTNSLTIDNLVPGTTSDSNTVTVTVSSNTPYGYVLSAGVGSTVSTDPYYNTSDLVHDNSTTQVPTTNKFSSIATSASLPTLDTDNTWGYSTSTDGGTNWSAYSGLSHTATKPLLDISDPATPSSIDFKIAARSASTQASGTYNNVITFYAVGKPKPPTYMQDTTTIKAELQNIGDEMQVQDARDGKMYWVAKQADGNIWMIQNLDLCISCGGTTMLTSQNTDLNVFGSSMYSSGYSNTGGIITWSPSSTSRTSSHLINDTSVSGWSNSSTKPYSAEGGDVYIYTSDSTDDDSVFGSLAECTTAGYSIDACSHYHTGNYYNWAAAVASNSLTVLSNYTVASNSICPAGWRLPKGSSDSSSTATTREFGQLFYSSKVTNARDGSYYATGGFNKIRTSPLYFVRGGYIQGDSLKYRASSGSYLSSTAGIPNSNSAYLMSFSSSRLYSATANNYNVVEGRSIRCLMRQ